MIKENKTYSTEGSCLSATIIKILYTGNDYYKVKLKLTNKDTGEVYCSCARYKLFFDEVENWSEYVMPRV